MTTQKIDRVTRIDTNGTIFTTDVVKFFDDSGAEIAKGMPHISSYPPDTDIATIDDQEVAQLARVTWTQDKIIAYRALLQSAAGAFPGQGVG